MRVPFLGIGLASKSPYVTAKKLQNIYAETRPQGEKSTLVAYGTPGLTLFADFGDTPIRGAMEVDTGSLAYLVHRGTFYSINNAGVKTALGTLLTTDGRVSMETNGVQIMIVDGFYGYIYNTQTLAFTQITDPDFPANPTTVTTMGRRFVISISNTGRFYWSAIDDGLSWNALDFANAETNPDSTVAVLASNGQLILFGSRTSEYWGNSGALDQPFSTIAGTATEWGLAAIWSVAKYDNSIAALYKNRMGEVMIAKLAGYLPQKISNPDVDSIINSYSTVSDASAYSYMLGGHPMYVINFPSAGATWMYDGSTKIWTQLKSANSTRHRVQFAFPYLSSMMGTDYSSGRLYRIDSDALTDNGDSIQRIIVSENIASPDGDRFVVNKVRLDMEVGVGTTTGQGSYPLIGLEVSRDNGKTWGAQMWRTLGELGKYKTRVEWTRLGSGYSFVFRITITDPVKVTFVSACINPDD